MHSIVAAPVPTSETEGRGLHDMEEDEEEDDDDDNNNQGDDDE